ncbi:MAG TPA: hypothetical protein VND65_09460 [Candidatus Binatia bacterium]|nr:hypothetical protein [Candidatus Binatia bacterium]
MSPKTKSRPKDRDSVQGEVKPSELRGATLAVAVLVVFFVHVALPGLLILGLAGLSALLLVLAGLPAVLALASLASLLSFFLHIVCHQNSLLIRANRFARVIDLAAAS